MSKRKKQMAKSEIYALCITIGLVIGLGLSPMLNNLLLGVLTGGIGGTVVGFIMSKNQIAKNKNTH